MERITVPDMTIEERMACYYDNVTEYLRGQIGSLLSEIGFLAKLDLDSLRRDLNALAARDDLDFENLEDARRGLEGIRFAIGEGRSYDAATIEHAVKLAGSPDRDDSEAEKIAKVCRDAWDQYLRSEGIEPLFSSDREAIQ